MEFMYVLLDCHVVYANELSVHYDGAKMLHNQYKPRGRKTHFCAYVLLKIKGHNSQRTFIFWARNIRKKIQNQENVITEI